MQIRVGEPALFHRLYVPGGCFNIPPPALAPPKKGPSSGRILNGWIYMYRPLINTCLFSKQIKILVLFLCFWDNKKI